MGFVGLGQTNLFVPCKKRGQIGPIRCQCEFMRAGLTRDGPARLPTPSPVKLVVVRFADKCEIPFLGGVIEWQVWLSFFVKFFPCSIHGINFFFLFLFWWCSTDILCYEHYLVFGRKTFKICDVLCVNNILWKIILLHFWHSDNKDGREISR